MKLDNLIGKVDISITKAFLKSVSFSFDTDSEKNILPRINLELDLLSAGGKKVTTVTLSTSEYWGVKLHQDSIPPTVHKQIAKIVESLSPLCVRTINNIEGKLGYGK